MNNKEFKQIIDNWYAGRIEVDEKIKEVEVEASILNVEIKDFIQDLCKKNNLDFDNHWDMCKKFIDKYSNKNKKKYVTRGVVNCNPKATVPILDVETEEFLKGLCENNELNFDDLYNIWQEIIEKNKNVGHMEKADWDVDIEGLKSRREFLDNIDFKERDFIYNKIVDYYNIEIRACKNNRKEKTRPLFRTWDLIIKNLMERNIVKYEK